MNRILYSCLILVSLCLTGTLTAQVSSFTITPQIQCYNPSNSYTATAAIVAPVPGAATYSWQVIQSGTCTPSFTPVVGGVPTNSLINVSFSCCGDYTVYCFAYTSSGFLITNPALTEIGSIVCPGSSSVSVSQSLVCTGSPVTFSGSGASTYTWSNGSNNNPVTITPSLNTCLSFSGTAIFTVGVLGATVSCPVSSSVAACVSVQAITATITPASQTMCAGSPVNFTVNTNVIANSSVTAGTSISGYSWADPLAVPLASTTFTATDPTASGGNYSVFVTHTGAAGVCTYVAQSAVVISTSIPVSLVSSAVNGSICPGQNVTFTATSIQTAGTSYTWTQGPSTPTNLGTGNPKLITPGPTNLPNLITVDVNYFGCPGQATISLGERILTPTITASSGTSSCPNGAITLTATGGITYTFSAIPSSGTNTNTLPGAGNTAFHTPTFTNFPIQYCVRSTSAGCTGSVCLTVSERTLVPILSGSSASICPGTEFTLTSTSNGPSTGAGATYTFYEVSTPTLIATANSSLNTTVFTPNSFIPFVQTYSVDVDSAGCKGTGTFTLGLLTLKTVLSSSSPSICAGTQLTVSATGGAGTNYTFTSSDPQFTVSPTSTLILAGTTRSVTHTPPLSSTLTTYTVSTDSAGCVGSAVDTIGILNLGPTINFGPQVAAQSSICPGTSISFTANGAINYTFTSPAPSSTVFGTPVALTKAAIVTATDVTSPLAFAPFKVYTCFGDSGGCVGTKTIAIFERVLQPQIALSPTLVCSGQQVTLTASGVDITNVASPAVQYTFAAIPTNTIAPPGTSSVAVHNPTALTVYAAQVDSANCKGITPTITVNIRPDLALVVSASAPSVCAGLVSTLSVAGPTAATSIQYTWTQTVGSGSIVPFNPSFPDTIRVYPITNSTYSVFALDSLGCVGNTVINVGVDPTLTFSISTTNSSPTICTLFNSTLTASSNATAFTIGSINYTWSPSAGISPTTGSLVVAQPSATTIYTVKGDNGFSCKGENTVSVYVGIVPQPNYAATSNAVCPGFTSTLTAFGANSYTWISSTSSVAIAQQSISVGPGNFTIIASNGGSCTNTLSPVLIGLLTPSLALPINVVSSSPTTCISSNFPKFSKPVNLKASGAATYVWFPYNPNNMTYSLGASTDVRPPSTTQYTVIGSSAVCSNTQIVNVNVIPQFSMNVTPPLPAICLGDSLKLSITNIGTLAVGPASAFTYSWTEALNAPPISLTSYFTPTVSVFPQNTTTYSVEVRDSRACISLPRLVTVTVLPRPLTAIAIPTINSVATNTVCFVGLNPGAQDVTINLTGVNLNPGLQFGVVPTYTWISPYPNTYNSILTPANNNAITVSAPIRELNNKAVVVYTLISGYNGVPGCFRQDTVSVRVIDCRPIRDVKFTTAQLVDTICVRSCITYVNLTDTMAGIPQKLKWTFQGGSPATSTANIPTVCYNFPGKYDVILQVSNPYPLINPTGGPPGSTLTIGKLSYIKVVDVPNVTIVAPGQLLSDTAIKFGQTVDLNGSGAIRYSWLPPYNISSLSNPSVQVAPHRTTQYILTGYNSKACFSSDTIDVRVYGLDSCTSMYVPNAFTPNNDGVNDVLYVRGICLESLTFMIFNRWGEKVFETADQKNGWDGSYKGEDLNTGVFVFRLEGKTFKGEAFELKGNITLLR